MKGPLMAFWGLSGAAQGVRTDPPLDRRKRKCFFLSPCAESFSRACQQQMSTPGYVSIARGNMRAWRGKSAVEGRCGRGVGAFRASRDAACREATTKFEQNLSGAFEALIVHCKLAKGQPQGKLCIVSWEEKNEHGKGSLFRI